MGFYAMKFMNGIDSDRKRLLRYFRSFFILLLVVALLFCCLQYFYTGYLVRQQNHISSRNTFALLKHAQDVTFDQIIHSLTGLFNNTQFSNFMDYYYSNDVKQQLAVLNTLESIKNSLTCLENICFYYPEYGYTLSNVQTISELSLYHDRDFLLTLKGRSFPALQTYVRSVSRPFTQSSTDVVTLVCSLPLSSSSNGEKTYYAIVDLKYAAITSAFADIVLGNDSGLMIFDAQGTLISGIGKTYPMDLLVQDPQSLSDAIVTLQRTIDDDELYIYCTRNPEMNWIYVYAQNTQSFSSRLYEIRNWILVIFLGVVTIGILYAWFVSKQLCHPIHLISEQLGNPDVDVFDRIDDMISQNERLNNELQENLVTGRNQQLLQRMLLNFNTDSAEQGRLNLQPGENACAFYLISAAVEESSLSTERLEQLFAQYQMRLLIKLYTAPNEIACIVASPGFAQDTILLPAQALLAQLRQEGVLINIGVSRPFKDVSTLSDAYRQAEEALGMHLVRGEGVVCCFWEIRNHAEPDYPYKIENAVLRAFRDHNAEELQRKLLEFQTYLVEKDANAQVVRDFYVQFFCSCQRLVLDLPPQYGSVIVNYSHRNLISQPTLDDMSAYLFEMLSTLLAQTEKSDGKSELIERICAYIDAHLAEAPTVEKLASEFFISSSGLRAEFSRVMGMSIKTYTDLQRLKLAKQLLEDNSLRVQDIAGRIGFNYVQSFITFFKAATNLTPGEYRQMVNLKKIQEIDNPVETDGSEDVPPQE